MVRNIKKKILVIGIGSIGFRHCESLLNLSEIELHIVDINKKNINKLLIFFRKSKSKNNKLFSYPALFDIKEIKFDLAIISTNADVRFAIFEEISKKFKIKNILFEKFVFTNKVEFAKTSRILKNKNIKAWVNCPRRMQSMYVFIKNFIKIRKNKFHLSYSGSNWQMSSNIIHFIDLFSFLSSSEKIKSSEIKLANSIFKSKRKNFQDFFGELNFSNQKGDVLQVANYKKKIPTKFIIKCNKEQIVIDENSGFIRINEKLKKFPLLKQSQLSEIFAIKVFGKKKILLSTFDKSKFYHLLILNIFQTFYKKKSINIT
tara:strand:+ start:2723 stop:3670 length:948 start_codon:yes stop_codon:yes gene_type:complete